MREFGVLVWCLVASQMRRWMFVFVGWHTLLNIMACLTTVLVREVDRAYLKLPVKAQSRVAAESARSSHGEIIHSVGHQLRCQESFHWGWTQYLCSLCIETDMWISNSKIVSCDHLVFQQYWSLSYTGSWLMLKIWGLHMSRLDISTYIKTGMLGFDIEINRVDHQPWLSLGDHLIMVAQGVLQLCRIWLPD